MSPLPRVLCQQLGRWWAAQASLLFCEPTSSTPSNIYAVELPERAYRLSPAASIVTVLPSQAARVERVTVIDLVVTASAGTRAAAEGMLDGLTDVLFPGGSHASFTDEWESQQRRGLPGIPAASTVQVGESIELWRVTQIEAVGGIVPIVT
ncbi:MAG: hypothetical protein AAF747_08585, partial [Planctomycetota bacterium]